MSGLESWFHDIQGAAVSHDPKNANRFVQYIGIAWTLKPTSEKMFIIPSDMSRLESVLLPAVMFAIQGNEPIVQQVQAEQALRRQKYPNSAASTLTSRKILSIEIRHTNTFEEYMPVIIANELLQLQYPGDAHIETYWTKWQELERRAPQVDEATKRKSSELGMMCSASLVKVQLQFYNRQPAKEKTLRELKDTMDKTCVEVRTL